MMSSTYKTTIFIITAYVLIAAGASTAQNSFYTGFEGFSNVNEPMSFSSRRVTFRVEGDGRDSAM